VVSYSFFFAPFLTLFLLNGRLYVSFIFTPTVVPQKMTSTSLASCVLHLRGAGNPGQTIDLKSGGSTTSGSSPSYQASLDALREVHQNLLKAIQEKAADQRSPLEKNSNAGFVDEEDQNEFDLGEAPVEAPAGNASGNAAGASTKVTEEDDEEGTPLGMDDESEPFAVAIREAQEHDGNDQAAKKLRFE
jgi:hypothetical protein